jgi:Flp pilus assembly pilin Flp
MDITDWIIRAAIFGVLAAVLIGTFQNLYDAIKNREKK